MSFKDLNNNSVTNIPQDINSFINNTTKKIGRPKTANPKTHKVMVYFDDVEYKIIKDKLKSDSLSSYIRNLIRKDIGI